MTRDRSQERGAVSLFTIVGLVALLGFGALALDVGVLYVKRARLQTAADLGALAGANRMIITGQQAEARAAAVAIARLNLDAGDQPAVAVTDADVTFPDVERIRVVANRAQDHTNAMRMFLAPVLGITQSDVRATGVALIRPACPADAECLLPFMVPVPFEWDDTCDSKQQNVNNGQLDLQSACEVTSVHNVRLYGAQDLGTQITLKYGDAHDAMAPGIFNPVAAPGGQGGSWYRGRIANQDCSGALPVSVGDDIDMEPGNMIGPTKQGFQDMLAADPGAYWWDGGGNPELARPRGGLAEDDPRNSPRVRHMAFYDPRYPPTTGRNSVEVVQLATVFVESIDNHGNVTARFFPTIASDPVAGGEECLFRAAVLVRE